MSSLASEVGSSIADLDPTGTASAILTLVFKIHNQYEQMKDNQDICRDLKKEVDLVSTIVSQLCTTSQLDPCQRTLKELNECLTQCLVVIERISAVKDTMGKIKAFLSANGDQNVIIKLTTQLRVIASILNLALNAKTANSVQEMTILMTKISEKESESLPGIQQNKAKINEDITLNVYVTPQTPSSDDRRNSVYLPTDIFHINQEQEKDKHILERLKEEIFMRGRGQSTSEKTRSMDVYNRVLSKHIMNINCMCFISIITLFQKRKIFWKQ